MAGSQMFRSLRHRNARLFFIGLLVSNIGTWLQLTAMSLLVYRLTGKATDVGITLLCQFLPMLVFGVWAGAVADRVNKRVMTIATQSALGVQALVLGALELAGLVNLHVVFGMSLLLGVINALDNPARRGLVLELVEPDEITNVIALNTGVMTGSRIFGPALAAALVGPLGPGWLFIANGLSFVAILVPILRIDRSQMYVTTPAARGGRPVREAFRFVYSNRRLLVVFAVFTAIGTFSFNYNVSLLTLADDRFGDERLFGWLLAIVSVGSLIGSLLTAAQHRVGLQWFFGSALLLGISGLAVAWAPSIWLAYVFSIPLGAGGAAFIAALNSISQLEAPPEMRGRILALGAVAFLGTTPIGAPITGWVADHISAEWSLAYGSIICLVCVVAGVAARRRSISGDVPAGQYQVAPTVIEHTDGGGFVIEH
jgi:MFS family permease